jgi:hypothetical protein
MVWYDISIQLFGNIETKKVVCRISQIKLYINKIEFMGK